MKMLSNVALSLIFILVIICIDKISGEINIHYKENIFLNDRRVSFINVTFILKDFYNNSLREPGVVARVLIASLDGVVNRTAFSSNGIVSFLNIYSNTYFIKVFWKNVIVFNETRVLDKNETVFLKCNVGKIRLNIKDKNGLTDISNARVSISGVIEEEKITDEFGHIDTFLPFGKYRISNISYTLISLDSSKQILIDITPPHPFTFNIPNQTSLTINTEVYSLTIFLRDFENNVFNKANTVIKILYREKYEIFRDVPDINGSISIDSLPKTDYEIIVEWENCTIFTQNIYLNKTRDILLKLPFFKEIYIEFLDPQMRPIKGLNITISTPLNKTFSEITDISGNIVLKDTITGKYTCIFKWMNRTITIKFYINTKYTVIKLQFYTLLIKLMRERGKIPDNVNISIYRGERIIASKLLIGNNSVVFTHLLEDTYIIKGYWHNVEIFSTTVLIKGDENITISPGIYTLLLNFSNKYMDEVSRITLILYMPNNTVSSFFLNNSNTIVFECLPRGVYTLKIYWYNTDIPIGEETVILDRDISKNIVLDLDKIEIYIKGFMGNLGKSKVNLYIILPNNTRIFIGGFYTDSNGYLKIANVPVLSDAKYIADILFDNYIYTNYYLTCGKLNIITLNIINIYGISITILQFILIITIIPAITIISYFYYRKYRMKKLVEEIISEPEIEEEEEYFEEEESFIDKIKKLFKKEK